MSERKTGPTPKRPRRPTRRNRLDHKRKAQRFIIAGAVLTCLIALVISGLAGIQGIVALPASPGATGTATPTAVPTPSESEKLDPQTALKFQAAALAIYLGQGIDAKDPAITPEMTTIPGELKSGEQAPEIVVPTAFRITRAGSEELVVCVRASVPGSGLTDEYFVYPIEYEGEKVSRCPQDAPTEVPKPSPTKSKGPKPESR